MFEKKDWKKGDPILAVDLSRIEGGIESAHAKINAIEIPTIEQKVLTANAEDLIERVKLIPRLDEKAKPADIAKAFNDLIDAIAGNQEQAEGE